MNDDIVDRLHRLDADHCGVIDAFGEAAREISRLRAIRAEMARALEACRSALDGLMGDTDLDGDDSPEMKAMQMASAALSKHRDANRSGK